MTKDLMVWMEKVRVRSLVMFGRAAQTIKAVEEFSEACAVLARHLLGQVDNIEEVREEIADAIVMALQMRYVFGEAEVDEWVRRKLHRHSVRMDEIEQKRLAEVRNYEDQ
jgi:hypothetical protein